MTNRFRPTLTQEEQQYVTDILKKIQTIMQKKNISQEELAKKLGTNQSTVSKLLNGDSMMPINTLLKICTIFQVNITSVISPSLDSSSIDPLTTYCVHNTSNSFITNPNAREFNGYLNQYFFYSKPTISNENKLLKGIFKMESDEDATGPYCKCTLLIRTGKNSPNGTPVEKKYTGRIILSNYLRCFLGLLISQEYSDFVFVSFHHIHLNIESLSSRLIAVSTISAGSSNDPVLLKALISSKELNDDDIKKNLDGFLHISNSNLLFSKKYYDSIKDQINPDICKIIESQCLEYYYKFDEYIIKRSSNEIPDQDKAQAINLLRKNDASLKYVKISNKVEKMIHNHINEIRIKG